MNFDDTPAEAAFRDEARSWIKANAPHELRPWLERSAFAAITLAEGVDAIAEFFDRVWTAFPDMRMQPARVVEENGAVAAEWVMTGTHLGDFPGLPATGNAIHVRGISLIDLAAGRVKRVSDYWDLASSGLLPTPSAS